MSGRVASAIAVLAGLAVLGVAHAAELTGTERADRLVGSPVADTIRGLGGNDRIEGRAGADLLHGGAGRDTILGQAGRDRIVLQQDGSTDSASCGAGLDIVNGGARRLPSPTTARSSPGSCRATRTTSLAQHETQVEPDSVSFGSTIVTAFQSGRLVDGGAVGIGWATSVDAGRTWRSGHLERVTARASDPVVAYDRLRRTWLIADAGGARPAQLLVSRSTDGRAWSRPAPAAADPAEDYDKEWLVCDSWRSSRFFGRCYLAYLETDTLRSASGGLQTAGSPVGSRHSAGDSGRARGTEPSLSFAPTARFSSCGASTARGTRARTRSSCPALSTEA